jgi:hypothetical protein
LVFAACVNVVGAADLVGKITYKGTPPPGRIITLDKICSELAKTNKTEVADYSIGTSNALAGVVVYVRETAPGAQPRTGSVVIEKKGCVYTPYVTAVQVNQPVLFRNSDPMMHNIRLKRSEVGNPGLNLVQYAKAADMTHKFPKAEPFVEVQSDYAANLSAYIYVLNTPHFVITDKSGAYSLTGLPAGNYTLVAHHRLAGQQELSVTLGSKNATNDFVFPK